MQDLRTRRNGPGLLRLGTQLLLLVGSAGATAILAAAGNPAWLAAALSCGLVLPAFFAVMHEAAHQTAFRSHGLNEVAIWVGSLLMLQVPSYFREFHFEHHRSTQDREKDPELASAPDLMDSWPRNLAHYLLLATGQALMLGKVVLSLAPALLPVSRGWERFYPYVRRDRRRRLAWESRAFAVLLAAVAYAAVSLPGALAVLVAWPVAHLLLGLFLMPEHTGLPHTGSQLERTRTIRSNALVRWWMWNMPYHAEHHANPVVPFHALPRLHRSLEPELVNLTPGYLAFHREALRRAVRG
jgi:fatty acid desaturase